MARHSYVICGRHFPAKNALEKEVKRIRDTAKLDTDLDPKDRDFVYEVFKQLYPYWDKYNMGIGVISIQPQRLINGRCFKFFLKDGSTVDPSLQKTFNPCLADPKTEALKALRHEVWPDVVLYRDWYFGQHGDEYGFAPCELSDKEILASDCEVDHYPMTFRSIADQYAAERGIDLATIETMTNPKNLGVMLADRDFAKDWREYHAGKAKFRVLARSVHVEITRPGRVQTSSIN